MIVWRLKKGSDRRFREGHPWIFASELGHSAKEIRPGEVIELRDALNHFLAYGYGHPSSQICFRRLSSRTQDNDVLSERFFIQRLRAARELRVFSGCAKASHRWVYAEADGIPGLIVDCFLTEAQGWLVVVQASTAGIERALPQIFAALETFAHELGLITIVEAPSSKARKLEGLEVNSKRIVSGGATGLEDCQIRLGHGMTMACDFIHGQKTGFFLDQQWNAGLLRSLVRHQFSACERPVRVLDICCYVGQWSAHVAHALREVNVDSEVTLFDSSAEALGFARKNLARLEVQTEAIEGDALKDLAQLSAVDRAFDVIICDPPAFVKKRADLAVGLKAYVKLNREAQRLANPGSLYVASSCSGFVKAEDWRETLLQSSQKAGRMFKQLVRGGHGPDHPVRAEFPEGEYLKCTMGRIDYPY